MFRPMGNVREVTDSVRSQATAAYLLIRSLKAAVGK